MALFWWFTLLLLSLLAFCVYNLGLWFLSPYLIDRADRTTTGTPLRDYPLHDPLSDDQSPSSLFPIISDKATKSISLIFPAFNEESRLCACLDPTIEYLMAREQSHRDTKSLHPFSWEIIVVNDGSKDRTAQIVMQYSKQHGIDKVRLLDYAANQGKGFAVQQGMLHARGCLVLFADADGASEITHLSRLEKTLMDGLGVEDHWECPDRCAIAIGSRAHLQEQAEAERTVLRNILMWGFHFVVTWIGGIHSIKDTQCGFKLFTRSAVERTFMFQRIRRWCFDPELLMLAQKQHIAVHEVQIGWQEIEGSKLTPLKAAVNMFREILLVRICYQLGIWYTEIADSKL